MVVALSGVMGPQAYAAGDDREKRSDHLTGRPTRSSRGQARCFSNQCCAYGPEL